MRPLKVQQSWEAKEGPVDPESELLVSPDALKPVLKPKVVPVAKENELRPKELEEKIALDAL